MDLENTGKDWKEEAPLLAGMKVKNPFIVPENYFNTLETQINSLRILEDARFNHEDEFTVPANYFESLTSKIETRIAENNIQEIAVTDGFSVQEDYFINLQQKITDQISGNDRTVDAVIKPIRSNWLKYAVAACITVILGSVLVFNTQNDTIESQMNELSDQEIVNYLQMNSDIGDTPVILENLSQNTSFIDLGTSFSDTELEYYINTTL